jgi:hypothetical protein
MEIEDEREKKKEKEKVIGVKSEGCWSHALPRNGGAAKTILTSPDKPPYVQPNTSLHTGQIALKQLTR